MSPSSQQEPGDIADMLRVAYFGSDAFSVICLQQLLPLLKSPNPIISHLDIITRSPKPSGRGMRQLKEVQLATFAVTENLPLLRADRKVDFSSLAANNYDLAIAVSYGKLIPSTFLTSLRNGGLNVHPSILPRHSGPAPLQRALLNHDPVSGVTVQNLHPTEFDKGDIIAIEEHHIKREETISSLSETLATAGGKLLVKVLKTKAYDMKSPNFAPLKPTVEFSYAAKVQPAERQVTWQEATKFDVLRKYNTLGQVYTNMRTTARKGKPEGLKRVVFPKVIESVCPLTESSAQLPNGSFSLNEQTGTLDIKVEDGYISVDQVKTEGIGAESPAKFFNSLKKKFGHSDALFVYQQ